MWNDTHFSLEKNNGNYLFSGEEKERKN